MTSGTLDGLKVAILVTDGFERVEMTDPGKALDEAGAETQLVSPKDGQAKALFDAGKPVASIHHGPSTIIEAGAAPGWRLSSSPSLKTDLKNAVAECVDQEVVVEHSVITSRKLDYIPAFNLEMIKLFASARGHSRQGATR